MQKKNIFRLNRLIKKTGASGPGLGLDSVEKMVEQGKLSKIQDDPVQSDPPLNSVSELQPEELFCPMCHQDV